MNGTPVDVGRAQLCGVGKLFGVCLDGMLFRGDAEMRAEGERDPQHDLAVRGADDWDHGLVSQRD